MTFPNYIIFESYTIALFLLSCWICTFSKLSALSFVDRFLQQLQSKAEEVQKESSAEEGYSTNEESDLVLIMCVIYYAV